MYKDNDRITSKKDNGHSRKNSKNFNSKKNDFFDFEPTVNYKGNKGKSSQYNKCRNSDCDYNQRGFCQHYKNKAKSVCRDFY